MRPGLERVLAFLRVALATDGRRLDAKDDGTFVVLGSNDEVASHLTLSRDDARDRADLDLLGLDHPLVQEALERWQAVTPERIGLSVAGPDGPGVLTWWLVETKGPSAEHRAVVVSLGVTSDGKRHARLERLGTGVFSSGAYTNLVPSAASRRSLLHETVEPMLERELQHREVVPAGGSYAAKLIGWVEVGAS